MKGVVRIEKIRVSDGKVVDTRETHNLVVTAGYDELILVLGGTAPGQHYIDRMQFGTGNAAPTAADATLAMPITPIKDIASIDYPDAGSPYVIAAEAYLLSGEGNGFSISEAGLFTVASVMSARAVFVDMVKTSDYILRGTWSIGY